MGTDNDPKMGTVSFRGNAMNDLSSDPKQPNFWQAVQEANRPSGVSGVGTSWAYPAAIFGDLLPNLKRRCLEFFVGKQIDSQGHQYKGVWIPAGQSLGGRYYLEERFRRLPRLAATPGSSKGLEIVTIRIEPGAGATGTSDTARATVQRACKVKSVTLRLDANEASLTCTLRKCASATAVGSGTDMLASALALSGTVDTNVAGALHATPGNYTLAAGDTIGLDMSAASTTAKGVITVELEDLNVAANEDYELAGTNAADANVTRSTTGGISAVTSATTNDQVIIQPTSAGPVGGTSWTPNKKLVWETILELASNAASLGVWAGLKLTNTRTVATDDDQIFFYFTSGASDTVYWHIVSSVTGSADVDTNLGVSTDPLKKAAGLIAASTQYHLRIEIDADRIATCYINGVEVYRSAALTASATLQPFSGQQTLTTAAKTVVWRGRSISKEY